MREKNSGNEHCLIQTIRHFYWIRDCDIEISLEQTPTNEWLEAEFTWLGTSEEVPKHCVLDLFGWSSKGVYFWNCCWMYRQQRFQFDSRMWGRAIIHWSGQVYIIGKQRYEPWKALKAHWQAILNKKFTIRSCCHLSVEWQILERRKSWRNYSKNTSWVCSMEKYRNSVVSQSILHQLRPDKTYVN